MSCGNRFQCGLSKPSRSQFQPDKPSNPDLHNENQKRLNELLRAREDMDKAFVAPSQQTQQTQQHQQTLQTTKEQTPLQQFNELEPSNNIDYTPWKTPSATLFALKKAH
jgi:hypothetical protein